MAALGLSTAPLLDARRIGELFQALDTKLDRVGIRNPVELVVVGGAAVALQWNRRRTTYDVDVVSEGIPAVFWDVAAAVGRDAGLEDDWLNAAARVKAPTGPTPGEPAEIYAGSNLRVYGASPHYVLAMKLLTGRNVDLQDLPMLLDCGPAGNPRRVVRPGRARVSDGSHTSRRPLHHRAVVGGLRR